MSRDQASIEVGELLANERPIDRYLCKGGPGGDDYLLLRNPTEASSISFRYGMGTECLRKGLKQEVWRGPRPPWPSS